MTDSRFDARASCLLERFRVQKGSVVDTLSARKANASQEGSVVRRSEPSEVLRAEGPCRTPVQQSIGYLDLQNTDFQTMWSGRPIIRLRFEMFEACPHETDPSFDFTRSRSAFVYDAAQV